MTNKDYNLYKSICLWYLRKTVHNLPSILTNINPEDLFYILQIPSKINTVLFSFVVNRKRRIIGSRKVIFDVQLRSFKIYANKTYTHEIGLCEYKMKNETLIIKCERKKYKLMGENIRMLYTVLMDEKMREEMREEMVNINIVYNIGYKDITVLLLGVINNSELTKLVREKDNLNLKNRLDMLCEYLKCAPIYRIKLPTLTSYSHEPLSKLQRLCEQFINYKLLVNKGDGLVLQVIEYFVKSYAIFNNRIKKYYEALTGETFVIKEELYEIYAEKSDYKTINLLLITNDFLFIMHNDSVEIRYDNLLIKYTYNMDLLMNPTHIARNVLNTKETIYFYKTDEIIPTLKDKKNQFQGSCSNIFANARLSLQTKTNNNFDYKAHIIFSSDCISGYVNDSQHRRLNLIKGSLAEELVFYHGVNRTVSLNKVTYPEYYNYTLFTMQLGLYNKRDDILAQEKGYFDEARDLYSMNLNREKFNIKQKKFAGKLFIKIDDEWIFHNK